MNVKKVKAVVTAGVFVSLLAVCFWGNVDAAPKEKKSSPAKTVSAKAKASAVKAWDCAGCHKDKKVLPDAHVPIKDMPYDGCRVCHTTGGAASSLKTKIPGSHLHALRGITCEQCHGKVKKQEAVEMAKCISCHGETAKLAEKTAHVKPHNPHQSPHYGTDADCNLCHHQHAKSENLCAQCHKFDYVVP
jgi:hypothetical protein